MVSGSAEPVIIVDPGSFGRAAAADWANARIGLPWVDGAEGPDAYGCWGLVRAGLKDLGGIDLPAAPISELVATLARRAIRRDWRPSPLPGHLAIVLMGRSRTPHHVGLYLAIDRGLIVHALEGAGVITSSVLQLKVMGFQKLRYAVYAPEDAGAVAVAA